MAVAFALPQSATARGGPGNGEDKVTICHRTNSVKNPYVKISVDESAVDGEGKDDHSHHTGPVAWSEAVAQQLKDAKEKWGDIIPPVEGVTKGLNWTTVGMAVYNNDCQPVEEVTPAAVTFTAPTCDKLGTYTVPSSEGFVYKIGDDVAAAGTYTAQNGTTVTITAEVSGVGAFIPDGATDSWTYTFTAPTDCGQVLGAQVTAAPTGGVKAGGGGGAGSVSALVAGLVSSLAALGYGVLRLRYSA
jgi:hypothetical protein